MRISGCLSVSTVRALVADDITVAVVSTVRALVDGNVVIAADDGNDDGDDDGDFVACWPCCLWFPR